ncbi:hypothetical protein M8C21_010696 [Ambrosia artemisiifolia]|uniref:NADH-ubiquinone oxidoreductase chain 3 n=1 Tax=Ambrosia artemisiifolia TaxID=4212 RepID=A0AAD5BWN7_AMBAR|nr:hypothetical protein M8C21_010696 [Ambrosia artemisiifolia]
MFLHYEYDIFSAFLIISSFLPILIEPIGDAWLQFRIRYYMFALVFVVFDVETVFLYPWAMSFDVLCVSVFVEDLTFVLISIVALVYAWRKGALECS